MNHLLYFYLLLAMTVTPLSARAHDMGEEVFHSWGGASHMMFGGLMMVLFWGAVIALVILLVRWLAQGNKPSEAAEPSTALEILRKRYARGDIDKDEYEARKQDLEDG